MKVALLSLAGVVSIAASIVGLSLWRLGRESIDDPTGCDFE